MANRAEPVAPPTPRVMDAAYDNMSTQMDEEDDIPDDATVASTSFMGEDDRYDVSQPSTGHRNKRKREEPGQNMIEQTHTVYSDELLDYFCMAATPETTTWPEPPPNFQPDWVIDSEGHTAMHWAAAMGDLEVMRQMKRFGANVGAVNGQQETPLMRAVLFTNCMDKRTFPDVLRELSSTINATDINQATILHHAAMMTSSPLRHLCARYYLDVIMNELIGILEPDHFKRLLDAQDVDGNTAMHIAARFKARKCIRALMGREANSYIPNDKGVTAADMIMELNDTREAENQDRLQDRIHQASSSPFAPAHHQSFQDAVAAESSRLTVSHNSEAAMSIEHKVTPDIMSKFSALAQSFDDELNDKEQNHKEALRMIETSQQEINTVRDETMHLEFETPSADVKVEEENEFTRLQNHVISLREQQQQATLNGTIEEEAGKQNGHPTDDNDDLAERLRLAQLLSQEQEKRRHFVTQYSQALAMAGTGEQAQAYRQLVCKCVDMPMEELDENLDMLLEHAEEEEKARKLERLVPDPEGEVPHLYGGM